jgi:NAD(P)-dependent dehydrogenase (short-subunit alcohol dehydrogenase family)
MSSADYLYSLFGCKGRKAVVTGASDGLGREMVKVLVSAGADTLIVARRSELLESLAAELEDLEGRVHICTADLSDRGEIANVADRARTQMNGCDILVANAGIADRVRLEEMEETEFAEIVDLNVTSQWLLAKALFPLLSKASAGRVINIASVYGTGASPMHGMGAYTVSKHALVGLTRSQAVEWAEFGITSNAIAPAYFETEMTRSLLSNREASATLSALTPQHRFGHPTELATALLFLASHASSYVNGAIVPVDGGWTAW